MSETLLETLIQAGIATVAVIVIGGIVALLLRQASPLLAQTNQLWQTGAHFLEAQNKTLEVIAQRLQTALDREETANQKLREDMLEQMRRIVTLEVQEVEHKRVINANTSMMTTLQERIKELENQHQEDNRRIDNLTHRMAGMMEENERLNGEIEAVKTDRERREIEIQERNREIAALKAEAQESSKEIEKLRAEIQERNREVTELKEQIRALNDRIPAAPIIEIKPAESNDKPESKAA